MSFTAPERDSAEPIRGWLVFGEDARPFQDASVEIVLEDTTYADAPAEPVGRVVLHAVSYDGRPGRRIPFTVPRATSPPSGMLTLRVLVDIDGDGRLGAGDYRNAESVRVPSGPVSGLVVPVTRVE